VTPANGITPTGPNMFVEGSKEILEFPNPSAARLYLRLVIGKTPLNNGYATYKIYPRNDRRDPYTVASVNHMMTATGPVTLP